MITTACIWSPQAHTNIYVHCTHVPAHVKEENTCVTSKSKGLPIKFPLKTSLGVYVCEGSDQHGRARDENPKRNC